MAGYYPPTGFHFKEEVLDLPTIDEDVRFSDVSGLAVELGTEEIAEGGENRFTQKFPTRPKYPDLVLKRGLLPKSEVVKWIRSCIHDFDIQPKNIDINLQNENHEPLVTWHVINAYPTKWSVSDFNASGNAIVVESLQFYYQSFGVNEK